MIQKYSHILTLSQFTEDYISALGINDFLTRCYVDQMSLWEEVWEVDDPLEDDNGVAGQPPARSQTAFFENHVDRYYTRPDAESESDYWSRVSFDPNLSLHDVMDRPTAPWDWRGIGHAGNIKVSDIISVYTTAAGNKLPWNWMSICGNETITMSDVLCHPHIPWDWGTLSTNPSITLDDIINHRSIPWDYDSIVTYRPARSDFNQIRQLVLIRYISVRLIQHMWRDSTTNPVYNMCDLLLSRRLIC